MTRMSAGPSPDTNAAMALGMASTAMPFAASAHDEAERWLRILRLHGESGIALQALGVSEAPLEPQAENGRGRTGTAPEGDGDVIAAVTEGAVLIAGRRGAGTVGTADVLVAVMGVYGETFDHVLRTHGTDRTEVLERLGMKMPDAPASEAS
ncbi:MAG: hypothetical protein JWM29_1235 [Solirubrobacterales bacterium]|nr:hypothetical protein [Solirubrobacterales bacterium]